MLKKKVLAVLMAASVACASLAPSVMAAAEAETAENVGEAAAVTDITKNDYMEWGINTSLGIEKERELMKASGLSLDDWDRAVEEAKAEGLENALTEEKILAADPGTHIERQDGAAVYVGPGKAFGPVSGEMDAYRMAYALAELFGGSAQSDLHLWSKLKINDDTVYSFQQFTAGEEALGNTLKIAVDENGTVTGLFGKLTKEADSDAEMVTRAQAEEIVREKLQESGSGEALAEDRTERTLLSPYTFAESLRLEEEGEPEPNKIVWVVYSRNEAGNEEEGDGYPFTAHYVGMDGTYLKSLPVAEPGDEESRSSFRKQDVFASMVPDTYTGEITDVNGNTRTVTVPVMKSEADGKWYLGDAERLIAVADFWTLAYGEDHRIELVSSETNDDWDEEDIHMFFNYIRAWDFYANMGWIGPDGEKTGVIILRDMCFEDKASAMNACSIGKLENWQLFAYSRSSQDENGMGDPLVKGLDVMAHEYTHTFTGTVMNTNLYQNDLGAINEAMSDIMGNLVEYICGDTEDTQWALGENTGSAIRSMSDPHDFGQPEYVWDCFYGPHTDNPGPANDYGGVHGNSALLNRIAALLCMDDNMSLEDAVSFWTMTAMGMTPYMDYTQMPFLLEWALERSGNEAYQDGLEKLMEEEELTRTDLPDRIPLDQKIVKLELPDTEAFNDDNWMMMAVQLNTENAAALVSGTVQILMKMFEDPGNYEDMVEILGELVNSLEIDDGQLKLEVPEQDLSDEAKNEEMLSLISEVYTLGLNSLFQQSMTWREKGTNEIPVVQKDVPSLYFLMNVADGGATLNGMAFLLGSRWYDFSFVIKAAKEAAESLEEETEEWDPQLAFETGEQLARIAGEVVSDLFSEEETEEEIPEDPEAYADEIMDGLNNLTIVIDHLLSDEETEDISKLLTQTAKPEYLTNKGLDEVELVNAAQ